MPSKDGPGAVTPIAELRPLLHLARHQPLSCAIAMDRNRQGQILLHRLTKPKKLLAELKRKAKAAGTELDPTTLRFGRASVDGENDSGVVMFTVNKLAPGQMRRALLEQVRPAGFNGCEIVVDESLDTDTDEDAEADAGHSPDPPVQKLQLSGSMVALDGETAPGTQAPPARQESDLPRGSLEYGAKGASPPAAAASAADPQRTQSDTTSGDAVTLRARLTGLVSRAVNGAGPSGASSAAIKAVALAARDALMSGDLVAANRSTNSLDALLGGTSVHASSFGLEGAGLGNNARAPTLLPEAAPPFQSQQSPPEAAPVGSATSAGPFPPEPVPDGDQVGQSDATSARPAIQLVSYPGAGGSQTRRNHPAPSGEHRRTYTIFVPADCPSIDELERRMSKMASIPYDGRHWDWHGSLPSIDSLRNRPLTFYGPVVAAPAIERPPAPEAKGAPPDGPATMQEANERAWHGVDDASLAAMPEEQRYDLAHKKADDLARAQLKFMADHPGATALDFAKSAALLNTPQVLAAARDDIKEATNGDANAWARIGAAAGGTAKISGWLLAVVGVVYIASWAVGVGEVATLAVAAEALLATTMTASVVESEARLKAASQTKDPAEFKRDVEASAAAQTNIAMCVAAIIGLKALEITARIPAVREALDGVKASLKELREKTGASEAFGTLKAGVLKTMTEAKAKLGAALQSAKALAAKEAAILQAMSLDAFALAAGKPGGAFAMAGGPQGSRLNFGQLMTTAEGKKTVAEVKQRLGDALKNDVPKLLDQQFGRETGAVDDFVKAAQGAKDNPELGAAAKKLEDALGEPHARELLDKDQEQLVRKAADATAESSRGQPDTGTEQAGAAEAKLSRRERLEVARLKARNKKANKPTTQEEIDAALKTWREKEARESKARRERDGRNKGLPDDLQTDYERARDAVYDSDEKIREGVQAKDPEKKIEFTDFRGHHLIPMEALRGHVALAEAAARAGWGPDLAENLIGLPKDAEAQVRMEKAMGEKRGIHDSGHPQYNRSILDTMDRMEEQMKASGLQPGSKAYDEMVRNLFKNLEEDERGKLTMERLTMLDVPRQQVA